MLDLKERRENKGTRENEMRVDHKGSLVNQDKKEILDFVETKVIKGIMVLSGERGRSGIEGRLVSLALVVQLVKRVTMVIKVILVTRVYLVPRAFLLQQEACTLIGVGLIVLVYIHGTELVYSGRAASSTYGTDTLCFPHVPEYSSSSAIGTENAYGIEYKTHPAGLQNENVPCAVCYTSLRSTIMMIPAKLTCPTEWITEYTGYLMTDNSYRNSMHVCVDQNPESIPGLAADGNSYEWNTIKSACSNSGLPCPPYSTDDKALSCVVCSH